MNEEVMPRQVMTRPRARLAMRPGAWITWAVLAFFFINLLGVIATVVLDSFGRQWFSAWLPTGWTGSSRAATSPASER